MAIGDVFRVSIVHQLQDSEAMTVMHFKQATTQGSSDIENAMLVAAAVGDAYALNMETVLSEDWKLGCVQASKISPGTGPLTTYFRSTESTGDIEVDSVPPQTGALMTYYTTGAGRRGRGRSYLPGVPQTHVNSGTWIDTFWNSFVGAYGTFILPFFEPAGSNDWVHGVWSQADLAFYPTQLFQLRNTLQTQRRRVAKCVGLSFSEA